MHVLIESVDNLLLSSITENSDKERAGHKGVTYVE